MSVPTGTPISLLPTGTIDNANAVFPLSIGMPSAPQTIQASLAQTSKFLQTQGYFVSGSYSTLDGRYQPTGSFPTGTFNIEFFLGNGTSVVATGTTSAGYPYIEIPVPCRVDSWQIYADATGSMTANIFRSTAAGFPPTSPLAGLGQPILSGQRKSTGNATGTASLAQGDVLQIQIASAATIKLATVSLRARKV